MMMTQLPSYTSERYYLLSEIEQRCVFRYLHVDDGDEAPPDETTSTAAAAAAAAAADAVHEAFYVLWDLRAGSTQTEAQFRAAVSAVLGGPHRAADALSSLLAVEALVDKKDDGVANNNVDVVRDCIQTNIEWIKSAHRVGCVYVGVADHPAGAPALEAVMDYATIIDNHYHLGNGVMMMRSGTAVAGPRVRVVGVRQAHFLGHDPMREPDAASNVYQVGNACLGHLGTGMRLLHVLTSTCPCRSCSSRAQAECIFTASAPADDDSAIASSIAAWLKALGVGGTRPHAAANGLTKRKKGSNGAGTGGGARGSGGTNADDDNDDDDNDVNDSLAWPWSLSDSLVTVLVMGCVIVWVLSYFFSHRSQ